MKIILKMNITIHVWKPLLNDGLPFI